MSDILSNIKTVTVKIINRNNEEIDVSQQFLSINIWQSLLYKKFINARIVLSDTSDLITNLPIVGFEKVKISISNSYDTSFKNYEFRIYKIDRDLNTFKPTQRLKYLNIYLYTEEEYNSFSKISKRFNATGSNIIRDIITNNLQSTKSFEYDSDTTSIDFVSNFWDSEKCIDYICRKAQSDYYDFVFFENNNGYNFKSLSNLFKQDLVETIDFRITDEQFSSVLSGLAFQFNSYFDDLMWRKRGVFGSTGYLVDDDLYQFEILQESIQDFDDKIYHKGINRNYNDNEDVLNRVYVCDQDGDDVKNIKATHFNLLSRYNFVVNLNGDINRNVGDIYKINFPAFDNESVSGSDSFSGNWLINEINTQIDQNNNFKQNISFVKNSLLKNQSLNKY